MKRIVFGVLLMVILSSCNNVNESNYPVLSINITRKNTPSLFDIFKKIEIIPLETTDFSLIGNISHIDFYNSHYYIHDGRAESFWCFDEYGKFVRKIGNKGPGPKEYTLFTDFVINKNNNVVELLNPFGFLYIYELSGEFVKKINLPDIVPNYQEIMLLNDSIRILISSVKNDQDQLYVYSTQSNSIVNSFYKENPAIFQFNTNFFYQYNDCIYFYKPLTSMVFKINQYGYKVAYSWDFGELNPEKTKLDKDVTSERLIEMYMNAQIKGVHNIQFQNDRYFYTRFIRILNQELYSPSYTNVFYDKRDKKKIVFEKFKEDLYFFPIFWCNDYVIASSHTYQERAVDPAVLDEENIKKLNAIKEDDNPFLIKYYFR